MKTDLRIQKRNGEVVPFNAEKVITAITKAAQEVGELIPMVDMQVLIFPIVDVIRDSEDIFSVEDVQDLIEDGLMESGYNKVAKAYILYRAKKSIERDKGWEMTELQRDILYNKYVYEKEGFNGFIERVGYKNTPVQKMIRAKKFIPAGRILMGRRLFEYGKKVTYSNCFVITPPEDNIESIFDTAKKMARTYSYGGGCGTSLEKLRPRKATVNNSAKETTGAVSFMDLYSLTTGLIGQQGRRGALMLSMPVEHPDIIEFINVKTDLNRVTFANISVMISDAFMEAVKADEMWHMEFTVKDTGQVIKRKTRAKELLRLLAKNNWDYAEPGMLFWDRVKNYHINSADPTFKYASTNPCGEKPLPSGGSCLLGSINFAAYVKNGTFDYESFARGVRRMTAYLDDVLEEGLDLLPLDEQKESVAKYRQIGGGIMGLADAFILMGMRYGGKESLEASDKMGSIMANAALQESAMRAKELGTYPAYNKEYVLKSKYILDVATPETLDLIEKYGLRNAEILSIAPTGSISTMIGVSGGIEPIFQVSYTRESKTLKEEGSSFYKVFTPIAKEYMELHGIRKEEDLPSDLFVTSATLNYRERVDMQAIWQKYIDAAISSTVNVPFDFTVEEVEDMYMYAWEKGLKGITLFRDGGARLGILTTENDKKKEEIEDRVVDLPPILKNPHDKEICPECGGKMMVSGGCEECVKCGYSPCSI